MKTILVEGVWSLGGEARFVLAPQDPMGKGELDLWILHRETHFNILIKGDFMSLHILFLMEGRNVQYEVGTTILLILCGQVKKERR